VNFRKMGMMTASAMLVFLAACSSGGGDKAAAPAEQGAAPAAAQASKGPVELRVFWWGNADRAKLYDQIFDLYQKENPNVKIIREWTGFGDYWPKLATQAAGGNLPDVFGLHMLLYGGEYSNKKILEPLQPFVDKGVIKLDGWDKAAVDAGKVGGTLYAIPKGITISALIVNNSLIKSAGADLPPSNMNYDQFKDYLMKLKAKLTKDQYAITDVSYNDHGFESFLRGKGKSLMTEDGKKLGFAKEDLKEFWAYWDELRKAGIAPSPQVTAETSGQPAENSMFAKKKLAIDFQPSNYGKIYSRSLPQEDLGIMRFPSVNNAKFKSGENLQAPAWVISNKSKQKEEAAKLVNWFVNDLAPQKIYNLENGIPGTKTIRDGLMASLDPMDVKAVKHMEEISPDIPPTTIRPEGAPKVFTVYKKQLEQYAFGKLNLDQAVDTFFTEVEKALK